MVQPGPARAGRPSGETVDLAPNFRDGSAIHGQVYDAAWTQIGDGSFAIERGGEGWPWRYRTEIAYEVAQRHIGVTLSLRNLSETDMLGGIGIHPWFPTPVEVRIDCALTYGPNNDTHDTPRPVSGALDVRTPQTLSEGVDSTWTQPADPPVELSWPAHGFSAQMRAPFPTLHITAADAPERGAIAVEPQTHAPQGLRRLIDGQPGAMTVIPAGTEIVLPITLDFAPRP